MCAADGCDVWGEVMWLVLLFFSTPTITRAPGDNTLVPTS